MSSKGTTINASGDARTDAGWIEASTIAQLAAITVTGMQVAAAKSIADKQIKLARDYYDEFKKLNDFWWDTYSSCEAATVGMACGAGNVAPDYSVVGRFVTSARNQFARAREEVDRCVSRFCTGARDAILADLAIAEATAATDAGNFGARYAESKALALSDVNWSRRMQAMNLGRGLFSPQISFAQAAGNAYSSLGQQTSAAASSSLRGLGYLLERDRQPVQQYQPYGSAGMGSQTFMQTSPAATFGAFNQPSAISPQNSWFSQPYQQPTNYQFGTGLGNSPSVGGGGNVSGGYAGSFGGYGSYTQPSDGGFFTTHEPGTGG